MSVISRRLRIPLSITILLSFFLINSSAAAQTSINNPGSFSPLPQPPASIPIEYNTLYASANTDLWKIDPYSVTGDSLIGPIGSSGTDIAFSGTQLYGTNFSQIYTIDPTTGTGSNYKNIGGYSDVNALTVAPDGTIYAGTGSGVLLKITDYSSVATTLNPTLVGYYGPGLGSSGDLAISPDNIMFATVTRSGYYTDWLAKINLNNGSAYLIGDIGYAGVYGLDFKDWSLYGVTSSGNILEIDQTTGKGSLITKVNAGFWGLSTSGPLIQGGIVSPVDNYTTGPASIPIIATATIPGGVINQVEYYALYNKVWHSLGLGEKANNQYVVNWDTPTDLINSIPQIINLRIDIAGTLQNTIERASYAGGIRHIFVDPALSNPNIHYNWVPNRYYLSQWSLGANGVNECSVASIAMLLAMEGSIKGDYLSMATAANSMVNDVFNGPSGLGVESVYNEIKNHYINTAFQIDNVDANTGWNYLVSYIDAGHPVIVSSPQFAGVFPYGHFVVAVGYEESPTQKYMITYDPYGEWLGGKGLNYYINQPKDPASRVGQWVNYDLKSFSNDHVYLIAATAPVCTPTPTLPLCVPSSNTIKNPSSASVTPQISLPDDTTSEPLILGSFDGKNFIPASYMYLPLVSH